MKNISVSKALCQLSKEYYFTFCFVLLETSKQFLLRLLRTFAGVLPCPPGKNSYACHFKGKHGTPYIVGKLNKCSFRKKYELPVFLFHKRNLQKWPRKWPCVIPSNKWINRVPKFFRCLWNLTWTFLRCCETKACREFLKFIIFHPWRSSMQYPPCILCCSKLTY